MPRPSRAPSRSRTGIRPVLSPSHFSCRVPASFLAPRPSLPRGSYSACPPLKTLPPACSALILPKLHTPCDTSHSNMHRRLQVLQVVLQCCLLHRLWLQWLPLLQVCRNASLCQRTLPAHSAAVLPKATAQCRGGRGGVRGRALLPAAGWRRAPAASDFPLALPQGCSRTALCAPTNGRAGGLPRLCQHGGSGRALRQAEQAPQCAVVLLLCR